MKRLLLISVFFVSTFCVSAQNDSTSLFKNKLSINLSYSSVKSNTIQIPFSNTNNYGQPMYFTTGGQQNPQYNIELGYDITKHMTISGYFAGAAVGFNKLTDIDSLNTSFDVSVEGRRTYSYGLNLKYHLLPLLLKRDNLRLDIYATGRLGVITCYEYQLIDDNWQKVWLNPELEYGIGVGSAYYFSKHWGIFGEYYLGNFYNNSLTRWKAGITLKF